MKVKKILEMIVFLGMIAGFAACGVGELIEEIEKEKQENQTPGTGEGVCENCSVEEKKLKPYSQAVGDFSTSDVEAFVSHDDSVANESDASGLPGIGKLSDNEAIFYCSNDQKTSKGSVVKSMCSSDTSKRVYWYCNPEIGGIAYSFTGSIWYSHNYPESEAYGYFKCDGGETEVDFVSQQTLEARIDRSKSMPAKEAHISATASSTVLNGSLDEGYDLYTIKCQKYRYLKIILESSDMHPEISAWNQQTPNVSEFYETASFRFADKNAEDMLICGDDDIYVLQVGDYYKKPNGAFYKLTVFTGDVCDLEIAQDYEACQ